MSITDAIHNQAKKSYEYRVGVNDTKEEMNELISDELESLKDRIRVRSFHTIHKYTGYEGYVIDVHDLERLLDNFEQKVCKS